MTDPIGEYAFERSTAKLMNKFKDYSVQNVTPKKFCQVHSHGMFSNLIRAVFTDPFVRQHKCECGNQAQERCHKIGFERPVLLEKAITNVQPDITVSVDLYDIAVEFVRLHNNNTLTFMCKACHQKETSASRKKLK